MLFHGQTSQSQAQLLEHDFLGACTKQLRSRFQWYDVLSLQYDYAVFYLTFILLKEYSTLILKTRKAYRS